MTKNDVLVPENGIYNYNVYKSDSIYAFKIDKELTKEVLEFSNEIRKYAPKDVLQFQRNTLAGDLSEEYGLDFKNNVSLLRKIQEMMILNLSNIYQKDIISFKIDQGWVNFQKPNEYNPLHNHSGTLSLVWYLDVPECIRIEHLEQHSNSSSRGLIQFQATHAVDNVMFNPQTSDMLIFDSNHRHAVYPYRSKVERISLSMNITNICTFSDFYGRMDYL